MKINLMVSADREPTSAARASAISLHVDRGGRRNLRFFRKQKWR
jgi:hypothetical protein